MRPTTRVALPAALAVTLLLSACASGGEETIDLAPAPGTYTILSEDGEIRIPFELFRDDIRMIAEINGKELRMLIDNGVMWDEILFFGSPRIDSLGFEYDGEIQVGGPGEGDPVSADMASGVTVRFPGVEFSEQTAIVTPESSGLTELWEGADGQVSATFFKHFVVGIDFNDWEIVLTKPDAFQYRGGGREIAMEPQPHGSWTIPATVEMLDGSVTGVDLTVDLGGVQPLEFNTTDVRAPANAIETSVGYGVQGEIRGRIGRVRSVHIGGYVVDQVLTSFTSPEEGGGMDDATIGLPLLSRFNITFDYFNGRMFLEPNHRHRDPFEFDMSGMMLKPDPGGFFEIDQLIPGSPAGDAGLRAGDLITSVNGLPTREHKIWELKPVFLREGETVILGVFRGGEKWDVPIILRRLI